MPSLPALVAASTSACLLLHAPGYRQVVRDAGEDPQYARCTYDGPDEGPRFHYSQHLAGYKPKTQNCAFKCKSLVAEFGTKIMPSAFAPAFQPGTSGSSATCKCTAKGTTKTLIQFNVLRLDYCQPNSCWDKYEMLLNFHYEADNQVNFANRLNLKTGCETCEDPEDCADVNGLLSVAQLADQFAGAGQAEAEGQFKAMIEKEGVVLSVPLPTTFEGSLPCDPTKGLFPRQCLVVPGPRGDEWACQLKEQGCMGNQFLVQVGEGVVLSVIVFSVQNLLGEESVGGNIFTRDFKVRAEERGVRIALEDFQSSLFPLDYAVTGEGTQQVLKDTQGLFLSHANPTTTMVGVTQFKPEQVTVSEESDGVRSYTHKPMASNNMMAPPLDPSQYAGFCTPTSFDRSRTSWLREHATLS